jgi:hypothetical protein
MSIEEVAAVQSERWLDLVKDCDATVKQFEEDGDTGADEWLLEMAQEVANGFASAGRRKRLPRCQHHRRLPEHLWQAPPSSASSGTLAVTPCESVNSCPVVGLKSQ